MRKLIYRIVGTILFTLGIIYMPGEWWIKLLLWLGIGILANTEAFREK